MLRLLFILCWVLLFPISVHISLSFNYWSDSIRSTFVDNKPNGQLFDFIIVGSGSAGAVVAHRLSKHNRVLLLEAGGEPISLTNIPGFALNFLGYTQMDYTYKTVPQHDLYLGMVNNQSTWNRGKMLGGSSSLNYMFYLRGHPLDYDNWASIIGDDEWKYENVLPFFKKSIREYRGKFQNDKMINYGNSAHGFLTIERRKYRPMSKVLFDAGKEFGLDEVDANGNQRSGVADVEMTQTNSERGSTYTTILKDIMYSRRNLHVSKYSQAVKIKLGKIDSRAEGIWYYHHGELKFARVKKEIIISGGTIDSPKLLMLSGIGPKEHLKSIGVTPRIDLPVGQNLQDHGGTLLFPFIIDQPLTFISERDFGPEMFQEYFANSDGPLAVPSLVTTQIFLSSSYVKKIKHDWPDLQAFFVPTGMSTASRMLLAEAFGFKDAFLKAVLDPHEGKDGFHYFLIIARPKSFGHITLRDKNPSSSPLIQPNYFTHPDDMKVLLEGIKFLVRLSEETNSFKALNTKFSSVPLAGCEHHELRSDAYWECYVRHITFTMWHPVGTCRAGKKSDPRSVVDSKLRVLKAKGLRVIDASIMPVIVNANTNAPTMMIGEKGSHFIQEHWAKQYQVCDRLERFLNLDHRKCYYSQFP